MSSKHYWLPDLREMSKPELLQKAQDNFEKSIERAEDYSDPDRIGGSNASMARDAVSKAKAARGMAAGVCATMGKVEKPERFKYENAVRKSDKNKQARKTRQDAYEGDENALEKVISGETEMVDDRPEEMKGYHDPCESQIANMRTQVMKTEDKVRDRLR